MARNISKHIFWALAVVLLACTEATKAKVVFPIAISGTATCTCGSSATRCQWLWQDLTISPQKANVTCDAEIEYQPVFGVPYASGSLRMAAGFTSFDFDLTTTFFNYLKTELQLNTSSPLRLYGQPGPNFDHEIRVYLAHLESRLLLDSLTYGGFGSHGIIATIAPQINMHATPIVVKATRLLVNATTSVFAFGTKNWSPLVFDGVSMAMSSSTGLLFQAERVVFTIKNTSGIFVSTGTISQTATGNATVGEVLLQNVSATFNNSKFFVEANNINLTMLGTSGNYSAQHFISAAGTATLKNVNSVFAVQNFFNTNASASISIENSNIRLVDFNGQTFSFFNNPSPGNITTSLSVSNSVIRNQITRRLVEIASSGVGNQLTLRNSRMERFYLRASSVRLSDNSVIVNCSSHFNSTTTLLINSGHSQIVSNGADPNSATLFTDTNIGFSAGGGTLSLLSVPSASDRLQFAGNVLVGDSNSYTSPSTPCTLIAPKIHFAGMNDRLSTYCELVVSENITSRNYSLIAGLGAYAGLTLSTGANYDTKIELEGFYRLTVKISTNDTLIRRPPTSKWQSLYGLPKRIRLAWPATIDAPLLPPAKYPLFVTSDADASFLRTIATYNEDDSYWFRALSSPLEERAGESLISFERLMCPPPYLAVDLDGKICCTEGYCIIVGQINPEPVLIIPSSTNVTIVGYLTAQTLVISGLGSSVEVKGCAIHGLTTVTIELSIEDIDKIQSSPNGKLTKSLLWGSNCPSNVDISALNVAVKTKSKDCRRVEVRRASSSSPSKLDVLFSVNSSKCKIWWIVLASVLAGVVLIVAVVAVLVTTIVSKKRKKKKLASLGEG